MTITFMGAQVYEPGVGTSNLLVRLAILISQTVANSQGSIKSGLHLIEVAPESAVIHWNFKLATLLLLAGICAFAQRPTSKASLTAPMKMGRASADTFIGLVSDTSCGPRHKLKDKSAEECTRTCQRGAASFALVAGEKIYKLKGDINDVAVLAGQKAKVTGTLQGTTITVNTIQPAL